MDPDDPHSLALQAIEAGDFASAAEHAREIIRLQPGNYEGYLMLAQCLSETEPGSPRAHAYAEFALEKLARDEQASEQVDVAALERSLGISESLPPVPADVAAELEPHRLILQLYDSWRGTLDPSVLEDILANRDACRPLLLGILDEWRDEHVAEDHWIVVERALVILGEIGETADLPEILSFLMNPDDDLAGPAEWAFQRMAWQHPEETLAQIRKMLPDSDGLERVIFADQIGSIPVVPGRIELLCSLLEGTAGFKKDEIEGVTATVIGTIIGMEGAASPLAASLEAQYGKVLSRETRSDLRRIRREVGNNPAPPEAHEATIQQICCEEPEGHEHEQPAQRVDRPGRNEPCWCGSGKKYKKCHLAEDESAH